MDKVRARTGPMPRRAVRGLSISRDIEDTTIRRIQANEGLCGPAQKQVFGQALLHSHEKESSTRPNRTWSPDLISTGTPVRIRLPLRKLPLVAPMSSTNRYICPSR